MTPAKSAGLLDTGYTIQQLAELSQTTIRNIRAYQERGIFPPPEKRGRIGIYRKTHVARLSIINQLLSRGYSIANISEMLVAHEQGQDINQLIGLNQAIVNIWPEKNSLTLTIDELAARFSQPPSAQDIQYAFQVGVLEPVSQHLIKISDASLLQLAAILINHHFSFRQLLDIVVKLRQTLDTAAASIADIGLSFILPASFAPDGTGSAHIQTEPLLPEPPEHITELVQQLQPLLITIVDTEMANALSRSLKQKVTQRIANRVMR